MTPQKRSLSLVAAWSLLLPASAAAEAVEEPLLPRFETPSEQAERPPFLKPSELPPPPPAQPVAPAPPAAEAPPPLPVSNFRVQGGPFFGNFTQGYGQWFGAHARTWLLDTTGERRLSGYADAVLLHWKPDPNQPTPAPRRSDSAYLLGRVQRSWTDRVYTFFTAGGTIGDAVFPRLQLEAEVNYALPQLPGFVVAFGAGDRYFPDINRPYLVTGAAFALPRVAVIYHLWAGIAGRRSNTHLFTLSYGERLRHWVRVDLLFGNEAHPSGLTSRPSRTDVQGKGIAVSFEKWLTPTMGIITKGGLTEGSVAGPTDFAFHGWQASVEPFVEF